MLSSVYSLYSVIAVLADHKHTYTRVHTHTHIYMDRYCILMSLKKLLMSFSFEPLQASGPNAGPNERPVAVECLL